MKSDISMLDMTDRERTAFYMGYEKGKYDGVPHGKWEMVRHNIGNVDFRCSVCRKYKYHNGEMREKYKYCPGCGAKMDIELDSSEQMHLLFLRDGD